MPFPANRIEGVMPALVTPYSPDGSVSVDMIRRLVAFELEQGCHGFFLCGSTGEGLLLTRDERGLVTRTVVETVAGQAPVIVHVGAVSTDLAVLLAKDAKKAGAAAVASLPPLYYKVGLEGMRRHMQAVAEAAELPVYYYHIPRLTGVELSADEMVAALACVEGVVGLKFTHTDMFFLWSVLEAAKGQLSIFNGADQMLFHGLCTGACGGIGSTYNYQMRTIARIYEAVTTGDLETAREAQWQANRVIRVLFRNGADLSCEKAIMKLLGFDVGPPRSPLTAFPEERMDALRGELEEIDFFDG